MDHYEAGSTIGRAESPAIEYAFQDETVRVLKELFESKGLYQNLRVDAAIFANEGLANQFRKRPIVPHSHNDKLGGSGVQPLGTPHDEMEAGFYLPNINLECFRCARSTTFLSVPSYRRLRGDDLYQILGEDAEQILTLNYQCAVCRNTYVVFQVLRLGFKFQLTGRSIPFRPSISKEWPNDIQEIIKDAFVAAAENDVPAAHYHLRTAIEFYLKNQLKVPLADKIDGNTLCEKYNEQIDSRLKTGFPAVGALYAELSAGLHSRNVDASRFPKLADDFLAHLKAKALFAQYSTA